MAARVLKHDWKPRERELYANQIVWTYEGLRDHNGAVLCEMRSGPLSGEYRWFTEAEMVPDTSGKIVARYESESS